jgi:hypothetical protein
MMTTRFCAAAWNESGNKDELFGRPLDVGFWGVLRLAKGIDHDAKRVRDWYLTENIRELGGKTAKQLVEKGEADLVIGFLRAIRRGYRD